AKVEKRHTCVFWKTAEELKAKFVLGLTAAMRRHPGIGWVRADVIPSDATLAESLALRRRLSDLEAQLAADASRPPQGAEDLVQGDETFQVDYSITARDPKDGYPYSRDVRYAAMLNPSWNALFAAVAPTMMNEASEDELESAFRTWFEARARR